MIEIPSGTTQGICECSHHWSNHRLSIETGNWVLKCDSCGEDCQTLRARDNYYDVADQAQEFIDRVGSMAQHPSHQVHRVQREYGWKTQPQHFPIRGVNLVGDDRPTYRAWLEPRPSSRRRRLQTLALAWLDTLVHPIRLWFGR